MKILFVTSTRIGDAILSTGLLAHLIERHPDSRITLACGRLAAPLFAATPNVERVIALAKRRAGAHWLALWRECVTTFWDLVVDLRASALAYLVPAHARLVLRSRDDRVHRVEGLARLAGLDEVPAPRLWTGREHEARAAELVPAAGPVLALGSTANWPAKQWRPERFAELACRLTAPAGLLPGARVLMLGAAGEREAVDPLLAAIPEDRLVDLIGKIDLLTIYAMLKRVDLYIGNDSGLMHLAAASGCPTLGLFGPSREAHYAPWGERTAVVRTDLSYDEIVGAPDYDYRSDKCLMESLTVEAAQAAAEALWARCQPRDPR